MGRTDALHGCRWTGCVKTWLGHTSAPNHSVGQCSELARMFVVCDPFIDCVARHWDGSVDDADAFVEAAEQTVLQRVVPFDFQGRVFGFAQTIESGASPVTSMLIGPMAQWIVIPFMTTGAGVSSIGPWFGTGKDRGLALIFVIAGINLVCKTH